MTTGKTADRRIVSNSNPAAATISDDLRLDESTGPVCSGRPRFPLAVWTPPLAPVVMGAGGIWARSLIEMMFAAGQPTTSVCLALEGVDCPALHRDA
ncbi:hypothetical protein [Desulfocastanea catecholica]